MDTRGLGEPLHLPDDMYEASGVGQVMQDLFALRILVEQQGQVVYASNSYR